MRTTLLTSIPLLLVLACTATPSSPGREESQQQALDASDQPDTVHLSPGEMIQLQSPELKLRFEEVLADSRCLPDVECIWEGSVRVRLSLEQADTESRDVTLESSDAAGGSSSTDATGYHLTLLREVEPAPGGDGRHRIAIEIQRP